AVVHMDGYMRRGGFRVHDDLCLDELFKVVAGAAVIRVGVGVDDRFQSQPLIREKRQVAINLLANRIDQNGHMILFAADQIGLAFASVEFTKQHWKLLTLFFSFEPLEPFERFEPIPTFGYPQTLRANWVTSSSLRRISSQERRLPEAAEAKPHCVLSASFSVGTYLDACSMRRSNSSPDSSCGSLVVIKPRTTVLPFGPKRSGSNPPARSVSNSIRYRSILSEPKAFSAMGS